MTDLLTVVVGHVDTLTTALLVLVLLRLRVTVTWSRRAGFTVQVRY